MSTDDDGRKARDQLRKLIAEAGGVTALAKKAGLSKGYISGIANDKPFQLAGRARLEQLLGLRPGFFGVPTRHLRLVGSDGVPGVRSVPIKSWEDAAAPARPGAQTLDVAAELSPASYALLMDSDAMMSPSLIERSIPPGVFILVDPNQDPARGDDAVAQLQPGSRPCVRRVLEDGPFRYLKALNADYPGVLRITESVRILGRVVGMQATF